MTDDFSKMQRIKIHLICPCKNWRQARFHLAGIAREFAPLQLQQFIW